MTTGSGTTAGQPSHIHVARLAERNGWQPRQYGTSAQGVPLTAWWPTAQPSRLVWAAIHGEEAPTLLAAHQLLRTVHADDACAVVVPVANPDGVLLGTRQNANGVDLNRNFPATTWGPALSPTFWPTTLTRSPELRTCWSSPGTAPASEPEVAALVQLVETIGPRAVVDLHAPLDCVIATHERSIALAEHLAEPAGMRVLRQLQNPTPGDSARWLDEQGIVAVTYEIEMGPFPTLWKRHRQGLARAITEQLLHE